MKTKFIIPIFLSVLVLAEIGVVVGMTKSRMWGISNETSASVVPADVRKKHGTVQFSAHDFRKRLDFEDKIRNRFKIDDGSALETYYENWESSAHNSFETAKAINGTSGTIGPTYAQAELWFRWEAPESGMASFSTRGSIATPAYGNDTSLRVWLPVRPEELADSGAYGYLKSDENAQVLFSEANKDSDWLALYDSRSRYVYRNWPVRGKWLVEVTDNDDEDPNVFEWTSLLVFHADKGTTYYICSDSCTRGEIRLSWFMEGHEAEVACPVHRFFSKKYKGHFYTTSNAEKEFLVANNPNWEYEGEAYAANLTGGESLFPLYRFHSKSYNSHFFTIDPEERNSLILNNPKWEYEGIAFYVRSVPSPDTRPVYRFWSKKFRHHFFTTNKAEKDEIVANNPNWEYEGVAFHAFP